jgi:hypothetical protein
MNEQSIEGRATETRKLKPETMYSLRVSRFRLSGVRIDSVNGGLIGDNCTYVDSKC